MRTFLTAVLAFRTLPTYILRMLVLESARSINGGSFPLKNEIKESIFLFPASPGTQAKHSLYSLTTIHQAGTWVFTPPVRLNTLGAKRWLG